MAYGSAPRSFAPGEEEKYRAALAARPNGWTEPVGSVSTGTNLDRGQPRRASDLLTAGLIRPAAQSQFTAHGIRLGQAPQVQAMGVSYDGQDWRDRYQSDLMTQGSGVRDMSDQARYLDQVQQGQAGESLAELQMRQGLEQGQRQALGTALAGRGGTAAQIAAVRAGGDMALGVNQQAAQLRAQEQAQARDAYGQMLGQRQAAAQGMGALTAQQAGLEQGWTGQQLSAQGMNQQAMLAAQQANQDAWLGARATEAGTYNAAIGANAQIAQANLAAQDAKRERTQRTFESVMKAIGGGLLLSDADSKRNIEAAKRDAVRDFVAREAQGDPTAQVERRRAEQSVPGGRRSADALARVQPVEYEYRPDAYGASLAAGATPAAAPGERIVGVTTQGLTAAGLGDLVQRAPQGGQAVDIARASSTALTAGAQNSADIQRLEEELRRLRAGGGR